MAEKGRQLKLTKRVQPDQPETYGDRILNALNAGAYLEHACAYANVSRATAYGWIARGKDARALLEEHGNTSQLTNNDKACLDFSDAVEKARAAAVVDNLEVVRAAALNGTWQAAAWFLERTQPQFYGRQQKIEVEHAPLTGDAARQKLLELDLGTLADDEL